MLLINIVCVARTMFSTNFILVIYIHVYYFVNYSEFGASSPLGHNTFTFGIRSMEMLRGLRGELQS